MTTKQQTWASAQASRVAALTKAYRQERATFQAREYDTSLAIATNHSLVHAMTEVFGEDQAVMERETLYTAVGGWHRPAQEARTAIILPGLVPVDPEQGGNPAHDKTVCIVLACSNVAPGCVSATVWSRRQFWFDLANEAVDPETAHYHDGATRGPSLPLMSTEMFLEYVAAALGVYAASDPATPFRWVDPDTGRPLNFHPQDIWLTSELGQDGEA